MREIAIEGLDGSGKTSVAHALKQKLDADGQVTRIISPYRQANTLLGSEMHPLWQTREGSLRAIDALKRVFDHESSNDDCDVLIYDRHWMTAFTEIGAGQDARNWWGHELPQTAYLRVDPETARLRAGNDHDADWMTLDSLADYSQKYEALCRLYGSNLLGIYNSSDTTAETIARNIMWDMAVKR